MNFKKKREKKKYYLMKKKSFDELNNKNEFIDRSFN